MPSITELKRQGYRLQRTASLGATITLVSGCGNYCALFECAKRCADELGHRELEDLGDGIMESIPLYKIPHEDLHSALQKLSQKFSIALVEYAQTPKGGRFVALWRIERTTATPITPSTDLDDY